MGELNVPRAAADALKAIDVNLLNELIDQCVRCEQSFPIRALRLDSCGLYVSSKQQVFERALADLRSAKSAKKLAETAYDARKAGGDLLHAVQQMKERVVMEEREGLLFYVEDNVMQPLGFSENLTVRLSFRWRTTVEDRWTSGDIVFSHKVESRPNYLLAVPARKPSAARQERDRQEALCRTWEYLRDLGLQSVRDHFRRGGSGASIPQTFQAKPDSHSQGLNNFSAQFQFQKAAERQIP